MKPKTLFLVDGLGALITAVIVGVILVRYQNYIGLEESTLTYLAVLALAISATSFACLAFAKRKWAKYMKGIASANFAYALFALVIVASASAEVSWLGLTYFIVEAALISTLAFVEIRKVQFVRAKATNYKG